MGSCQSRLDEPFEIMAAIQSGDNRGLKKALQAIQQLIKKDFREEVDSLLQLGLPLAMYEVISSGLIKDETIVMMVFSIISKLIAHCGSDKNHSEYGKTLVLCLTRLIVDNASLRESQKNMALDVEETHNVMILVLIDLLNNATTDAKKFQDILYIVYGLVPLCRSGAAFALDEGIMDILDNWLERPSISCDYVFEVLLVLSMNDPKRSDCIHYLFRSLKG